MTFTATPGDLLEVPADAGDRAAGTDAGHEVGDPAVGLLPQLRAGGLVVRQGVVRVAVLVGLPRPGDLPGQPVRHVVVGARILRRDRGRADHDLGAVGLQHVALVLGDLVRTDEDTLVPAQLRDQCEPDAGVAGRSAPRSCRPAGAGRPARRPPPCAARCGPSRCRRGSGTRPWPAPWRVARRPRCAAAPAACCRSTRRRCRSNARRRGYLALAGGGATRGGRARSQYRNRSVSDSTAPANQTATKESSIRPSGPSSNSGTRSIGSRM